MGTIENINDYKRNTKEIKINAISAIIAGMGAYTMCVISKDLLKCILHDYHRYNIITCLGSKVILYKIAMITFNSSYASIEKMRREIERIITSEKETMEENDDGGSET